MKKVLALMLVFAMLLSFAACGKSESGGGAADTGSVNSEILANPDVQVEIPEDFKIGIICLHDENSTYDNNFIQAVYSVKEELGLSDEQVVLKVNVPEDAACYDAAAELVDEGCKVIFADSFGHETFMIQAAEEFPDVQFCHATGTKAKTQGLANYHNAFASIYEGRFLAGVAAGMKLNQMIADGKITADQAKIGYVGAFNYAEVVSGMTSFFLGVKYMCPSVTMKVQYTNSWFDIAKEKEAALALINSGCVLISQHADSEGAPKACEEKGVPNVAYNISTISMGPTTAIISSKIDWAPYFKIIIKSYSTGAAIPTDYCGTIESGSVALTELNEAVAAPGTKEKIEEIKAKLISGEIKVYDTNTFTVDGKKLETYLADVVDAGDFVPETEAIKDGVFAESSDRSAPYFDIKYIDGISE